MEEKPIFIPVDLVLRYKSAIGFMSYYMYRWDIEYPQGKIIDSVFDVEDLTKDPIKLVTSILLSDLLKNQRDRVQTLVTLCENILKKYNLQPTKQHDIYAIVAAVITLTSDAKNAIRLLAYLFGASRIQWSDKIIEGVIGEGKGVLEDGIHVYARPVNDMNALLSRAIEYVKPYVSQNAPVGDHLHEFLTKFLHMDKRMIKVVESAAKRSRVEFSMNNLIKGNLTLCLPKDNQGAMESIVHDRLCFADDQEGCSTLWLMARGYVVPECTCFDYSKTSNHNESENSNWTRVSQANSNNSNNIPITEPVPLVFTSPPVIKMDENKTALHESKSEPESKPEPIIKQDPEPPVNEDDDDDSKVCVVCMSADRTILFMPCRHLCTCKTHSNLANCPICQGPIEMRIEILRP